MLAVKIKAWNIKMGGLSIGHTAAFGWTLFVIWCLVPKVVTSADERPNFLLIFCDDIGFGDLASYGHPYAETPNLDRLAAEGTSFRQFHVNGNVCPVTRAGLMSSRNPSWYPNYTEDFGFMGQKTVTNVLKDAGYYTGKHYETRRCCWCDFISLSYPHTQRPYLSAFAGHIGKWNIGSDYVTDAVDNGIDYVRKTRSISGDPRGKEGLRIDEAIKFLEQKEANQIDAPFYLNLWLFTTHVPIVPPQSYVDHFSTLNVDRSKFGFHMQTKFDELLSIGGNINASMHDYLGEVLALDENVGRLLDKLDEMGLSDNTVVAFSSDNGPERLKAGINALGYSGGLRGEKHSYYEGGTRVPFIVRWPGHIPAGRVDDGSIMSGLDWLPSVASLAGADIPWNVVEGEDMSDVWKGNSRSREQPLFFRQWNTAGHGRVYVRYGRWKLHKREKELYDLATDPEERINLFDTRRDVYAKLLLAMSQWEATLPTDHARLPDSTLPFNPDRPVIKISPPEISDSFSSFAAPGNATVKSTGVPTAAPTISAVTPVPTKTPTSGVTPVSPPTLAPNKATASPIIQTASPTRSPVEPAPDSPDIVVPELTTAAPVPDPMRDTIASTTTSTATGANGAVGWTLGTTLLACVVAFY